MPYQSVNPYDGKILKTSMNLPTSNSRCMGIQEFVNKKLICVEAIDAPV